MGAFALKNCANDTRWKRAKSLSDITALTVACSKEPLCEVVGHHLVVLGVEEEEFA